jgi:thiol-disulfide isomerase/thioredoxin
MVEKKVKLATKATKKPAKKATKATKVKKAKKDDKLIYGESKYVKELKPSDFKVIDLKRKLVPLDGKPTITVYYAHWCPHCNSQEMTQLWESLAEALHKKKTGIQTAAFNADYNSKHNEIAEANGIQGFPTIQYSDSRVNSPTEYMGARDQKSILTFLHQAMNR